MKMISTLAVLMMCLILPFSHALAEDNTSEIITRHIEELAVGKGDPEVLPRHASIHLLTPKKITEFHARLKEAVNGWDYEKGPSWGDDMKWKVG